MKRIAVVAGDKTYYARPLCLGQLIEKKETINALAETEKLLINSGTLPVALLQQQGTIVMIALKNHDPNASDEIIQDMSANAIADAYVSAIVGTRLVEVPAAT